jgi:malate dehydrogenase (oxaloacetate-decarboxylating)(NADP+)
MHREEAYLWSEGPRHLRERQPVFSSAIRWPDCRAGQGNNVYIFPAIGLAVYATRAKRVTDEMFVAAAHAVAEEVTRAELDVGLIYPPQSEKPKTELYAAQRVAEVIFKRGLARVPQPKDIGAFIQLQTYKPEYQALI